MYFTFNFNNQFILDIGANLTDSMFQGFYGGKQKHEADLKFVLDRAWNIGMDKMILTVGTVNEAQSALNIAKTDGISIFLELSFQY